MKHRYKISAAMISAGVLIATLAYAQAKKSTTQQLILTPDTSLRGLIIDAGETLFHPEFDLPSGQTYTVNGTLVTTGTNSGAGTIEGTGTVRSMAQGEAGSDAVFTGDASFEGDVEILGTLTGGSPVKVAGGLQVEGGISTGDPSFDISGNVTTGGSLVVSSASSPPSGGGLIAVGNPAAGGPVIQHVVGTQTMYGHNVRYDGAWKSITSGESAAIRMDNGTGAMTYHTAIASVADETYANFDTTDIKFKIQNDGDTILTVQDDGATTCPDGGNVCSGLTALVCTPGANTAACSGQMIWQRVGNVVTGSINGAAAATGFPGQILFTFSSLPHMAASGNFATDDVAGTCVHHAAGSGAETATGSIQENAGTKTVLVDFEIIAHPFSRFMLCSFSYRLP